jgi:hypothetical protein
LAILNIGPEKLTLMISNPDWVVVIQSAVEVSCFGVLLDKRLEVTRRSRGRTKSIWEYQFSFDTPRVVTYGGLTLPKV